MQHMTCLRCDTVVPIEITDEMGQPIEEAAANVPGGNGTLAVLCPECITPDEATRLLKKDAVDLMNLAEEHIADLDMLKERQPAIADDPRFKEKYAAAEQHLTEGKAMLDALMNIDDEEEAP